MRWVYKQKKTNKENGKNRKNRNRIIEKVKSRKKFLFWNVAGIFNKDTEFWDYVVEIDNVSLSETWVENKDIGYVKSVLPADFEWEIIEATKKHKKGRAAGGFIIGIKKNGKGKNL